ncbi:isoprenoid biosynthesis glyoxalase ElbB [Azospirillum sp.]|uniref:isoprenoid biosynthesis glyoxalase ElbB n=1 Tax=Azospirillum sp. TaxID=34012 RepID=UPI003D715F4C
MANDKLRIGVVLSGCGVYDGAEIHEAVCTLIAIDRAGAEAVCYAPNVAQAHVIDHTTGQETGETRNVLVESARIARGKITDLAQFQAGDVDALIFPGGFGAAKNLSSFAFQGPDCTVNPDVEKAVRAMVQAGKPIGALCIAPAILAKLLGTEGVELTIGSDAGTAQALETLGAKHRTTTHCEVVVDKAHKVVTAPCYMLDASVAQIADGAANAVDALIGLVRSA